MALNDYEGNAKSAFSKGKLPVKRTAYKGRDSKMVKEQSHGLQDGPKPPGPLYNAVKQQSFNQNWHKEYQAAKNQSKSMIEAFKNAKTKQARIEIYIEFTCTSKREISM